MSTVAIRIEQLGKRYRAAPGAQRHATLRDRLTDVWQHLSWPTRPTLAPSRQVIQEFWALRDVTFDICAGEVLGLAGHNGSGKSTLLKILAKITAPTAGCAHVRGRVGALLEVGTGFHMELSGRENVFLSGAILGMRRAEIQRKFDAIVALSGIETFLEMPVKRYSTGMYLRLAFAVAAHLEAEILLLDEVLAVGDAAFQSQCVEHLCQLAVQGRAIVIVSHDQNLMRRICHRVVSFSGGQVQAVGKPATVLGAGQQAA